MNVKTLKNYDKDDIKISRALMATFVILAIQYLVLISFDLVGTYKSSQVQSISKLLVALAFMYALPSVFKRRKLRALLTILLGIIIFLVHFILYPQNREYMIPIIFPFFAMSIPSFIYALSIYDMHSLKREMQTASKIIFIVGVIIGFMVLTGNSSVGVYSMSLSYYLLLPSLMFLNELFDKPSMNNILFFTISTFVILTIGSRGPLLCLFVFSVLKIFGFRSRHDYKEFVMKLLIIFISIVVFIYHKQIIFNFYDLLYKLGVKSRTLMLLLIGEFGTSSSRLNIFQNLMNSLMKTPLKGVGIAGDRSINMNMGLYAHNFMLEILLNYGILIGFLILIIVMLLIIRIVLVKNQENYSMLVMWMCLGFVHLMVSGSYLTDMKFWIFIGLSVNFFLLSHRTKKIVKEATSIQ